MTWMEDAIAIADDGAWIAMPLSVGRTRHLRRIIVDDEGWFDGTIARGYVRQLPDHLDGHWIECQDRHPAAIPCLIVRPKR